MNISTEEQANEAEDLYLDYQDMLEELEGQGITEAPTIAEFAVWRAAELEANTGGTNPIPLIH